MGINDEQGQNIIFDCRMAMKLPSDHNEKTRFVITDCELSEKPVFDAADVSRNKNMALWIAFFPLLFFLPYVIQDKKNSEYLRFYSQSALLLIILYSGAGILMMISVCFTSIGGVAALIYLPVVLLQIWNMICVYGAEGKRILSRKKYMRN